MKKEILTIIPARGGSKGVPRKNIKILGGKPLIQYTLDALKESGVIGRIVVSTEDSEIADIVKSLGIDVVYRPEELAGDTVLTEPVMEHVVDYLKETEGYEPEYVSLVQCTSPFLSSDVIRKAVSKVLDDGFDSCITVFEPDGYEYKWKKDGDVFIPDHDVENRPRRQDLNLPHHENGAFYITKRELFKETLNRFGGNKARICAVEMSQRDSLQIDSEYDFYLAEKYIEYINSLQNII